MSAKSARKGRPGPAPQADAPARPDAYDTLTRPGESGEILINKSRFYGFARPVADETAYQAFLEEIRARYPDASHHCSCFILGPGQITQRFFDDGEPSGTAGIPMLECLKKRGLTDAALVVVRYFGGILLGAGGLVRAYSQAAAAAMNAAGPARVERSPLLAVTVDYDALGKVQYQLASRLCRVLGSDFTDRVTLRVLTPLREAANLTDQILQWTDGRAQIQQISEETCNWDDSFLQTAADCATNKSNSL